MRQLVTLLLLIFLTGCPPEMPTPETEVSTGLESSGHYVVETVALVHTANHGYTVHCAYVNWLKSHPDVELIDSALIPRGGDISTPDAITFIGRKR